MKFKFEKISQIKFKRIEEPMNNFPKYIIWFPYKNWFSIPCKDKEEVSWHINEISPTITFFIFVIKENITLTSLKDLYDYEENNK